jgi:hypothetical protein
VSLAPESARARQLADGVLQVMSRLLVLPSA